MFDLKNVQVIKNVAWLDERPQCQHLIGCWRAGRDTSERCERYGLRRTRRGGEPVAGYCPINGGICAMEDPAWVFKPRWDAWVEWCAQEHGYYTTAVWPGFRVGDLVAYVVEGNCMEPTYQDGEAVIARMGGDWENGDVCVFNRRVPGWRIPLRGKYLKRLERVGDGHIFVTADNPDFEPMLLPADAVHVRAVVVDGDLIELAQRVAPCHAFDETGRIVPNLRAVAVASTRLPTA